MYEKLLPLGSVVLLKGGNKRVMICSRIQTRKGENEIYDYAACYYPEGMIASDTLFFFNHDQIDHIFFIGFQDEEELAFHAQVLEKLGELEVRDGRVVSKNADMEV